MIYESTLVNNIEDNLISQNLRVKREVPLLSKRIDLIGYDIEKNNVVAVEAKVRNWKRAFRQALRYKLCSDEVYVAIYSKYLKNLDLRKFEKHGIGVMSVDENGDIEYISRPGNNNSLHVSLKNRIVEHLDEEVFI